MEVEVSPEEVVKGDMVVIKPGEKITINGTVLEGTAYVNQAAITGESIPVAKDIFGLLSFYRSCVFYKYIKQMV